MSDLPVIASFWHGSDLSFFEQVVVQSYLDHGHRFQLYVLGPIGGIPAGAEVCDARDILPDLPFPLEPPDRHRVAVFSDIFRLHLMAKQDCIWVDMDAYCVRPFDLGPGPIFACNPEGRALTGVMRLPQESPCLRGMLDFVMAENPIQPWRGRRFRASRAAEVANGGRWGIEDLSWGCSGPKAFTHFLKESGEYAAAMATPVFYPLLRDQVLKIFDRKGPWDEIEQPETRSVHLFGFAKRLILSDLGGLPPKGSYLDGICHRHGVDAGAAPVRAESFF